MRSINVLVLGAFLSGGAVAFAQPPAPGGGGQPPAAPGREGRPQPGGPGGEGRGQREAMSPERAKAAWEAEAKTLAKSLSLSDEQTKAVVKAYEEARKGYDADMLKLREKMRESGGGGPEAREAMEEFNKSQRDKLSKSLTDAKLSKEQVDKAMAILGQFQFHRTWDGMTDTLLGFKLEAAKQDEAMKAVGEYVAAVGKARGNPGEEIDREAMRTAQQEARKKLTDKLKTVLSEEQMRRMEAAMGMGGRRGGGEGGGPGKGKGPGAPAGS